VVELLRMAETIAIIGTRHSPDELWLRSPARPS